MADVKTKSPPKRGLKGGVLVVGVSAAVIGGFYAIATPFILPAFRKVALPYIPTTEQQVRNVFTILRAAGKKSGTLVDLGSGDGRIVIEAARRGFHATGYELNPWLVWFSRLSARLQGLHHRARFHRKDLWTIDLTQYDSAVTFGVPSMMPRLREKLKDELRDDGVFVSCRFTFADWLPQDSIEEGSHSVWLYNKKQTSQQLAQSGQLDV